VNAKEQVLTAGEIPDIKNTIQILSTAPSVLTKDDVDDFCQLASYYSDRTPSSFRRDLASCFYNGALVGSSSKTDSIASDIQNSFCLKISIPELLLSSQPNCDDDDEDEEESSKIRYFLVDCRPAEQYNEGHLLTAFHLDATLMLREKNEFDEALKSLFAAQEQAIQAGSTAAGEHLCFIGSGNEDEDQYMYMVVANLLQKRKTYISVVRGGYISLFTYLHDVGIDISEWIVGNKVTESQKISPDEVEDGKNKMEILVKKMAGNFFQKSLNWKEKITKFIENTDDEWTSNERPSTTNSSSNSKKKSNENSQSVFSIDDDDETNYEYDEEGIIANYKGPISSEEISKLTTWTSNPQMKHCFECKAVQADGLLETAYLYVTETDMRCLLEVKPRKRRLAPKNIWVRALQPRLLRCIARITSRRSFPELITFKFGDSEKMLELTEDSAESIKIVAIERYILVEAGTATKAIKQLIIESDEKFQTEKEAKKTGDIASTS